MAPAAKPSKAGITTPKASDPQEDASLPQYTAGMIEAKGNLEAYRRPGQAMMLISLEAAQEFIRRWGGEWKRFPHPTKPERELTGWFMSPEQQLKLMKDILPYCRIRQHTVLKYINSIKATLGQES